jgi:hypothetical protein
MSKTCEEDEMRPKIKTTLLDKGEVHTQILKKRQ